MQVIQVLHHCLYFKLNKLKFLFGLTHSLALDCSKLPKLTIDFIILPSAPYIPSLSTDFWHVESLPFLNCSNILILDEPSKKRIEHLLTLTIGPDSQRYHWDFLTNFQIDEEQLIRELVEIPLGPPIATKPYGVGFNCSPESLQIVVPEKGHSVLLIQGCDVFMLDPCQKIEQLLLYYGIPLTALKAVLVTDPTNVNWFECLIKLPTLQIIVERSVFLTCSNRLKTLFLWTGEMVKKRLKARVLCEPNKWHRRGCLEIAFQVDQKGASRSWEIQFGLRKIKIAHGNLNHFPSEIVKQAELCYFIVSDIDKEVKKQLESIPEAYRKKIILNRVSRKYHNKYFVTLGPKKELISVSAHPHSIPSILASQSYPAQLFRQKDQNAQLSITNLRHGQKYSGDERVAEVICGFVRDELGQLHEQGCQRVRNRVLSAEGRALIMHQTSALFHFYHGVQVCQPISSELSESLLSKVKDNSYVASLSRKRKSYIKDEQESSSATFEKGSEWDVFNRLCQMRTFEVGSQEADAQRCLYLIVKGAMKLSSGEAVAGRNMLIGNMKKVYCSWYDLEDKIEVLKDTWAVEVPLKLLHEQFFMQFPPKMYELLIRPLVFE